MHGAARDPVNWSRLELTEEVEHYRLPYPPGWWMSDNDSAWFALIT